MAKLFGCIEKNYYLCGDNSIHLINLIMRTRTYTVSADTASTLNVIEELVQHYTNICSLFENGDPTQEIQDAYDRLLIAEKNLLADGILDKLYQENEVSHLEI